jgi:N-acetylglutamate synthase-like GNAT family acetyltransferase
MIEPTVVSVEAAHVWELRRRMLRPGLPWEASKYEQDHLASTRHLAILEDDVVVACTTLFPQAFEQEAAVRLRGMAVDPAYQGRGWGSVLVQHSRRQAVSEDVELLWCNARVSAAGFYEKQGFQLTGPVFLTEPGVPHRVALLRVTDREK